MIIRVEQMRILEDSCQRGFESRMTDRVRQHFASHARQLDAQQLRTIVQVATEKARHYDLTHERSVALYLDLMCLLGSGFDSDPQYPWAPAILTDNSFPSQDARIDSLSERAWEYWGKISGEFETVADGGISRPIAALSQIGDGRLADTDPQTIAVRIVTEWQMLFPAKCLVIGEECLQQLAGKSFESASAYGITSERGCHLFATLMFLLGASFDRDPLLPWAAQALAGDGSVDAVARTTRLHEKASSILKDWWRSKAHG